MLKPYFRITRWIPLLLMPWIFASPGHQQPWYCLCMITISLSCMREGQHVPSQCWNIIKNADTLLNKTHHSADIVAVRSLNKVLTDTPAHSACFSRGQHVAAGCQQTNVVLQRWLHSCSHKITKTFKFKVHNHLLSHNNWLLGSGHKGGPCLVTWFCYHLIAKPGNKTGALPWPDP